MVSQGTGTQWKTVSWLLTIHPSWCAGGLGSLWLYSKAHNQWNRWSSTGFTFSSLTTWCESTRISKAWHTHRECHSLYYVITTRLEIYWWFLVPFTLVMAKSLLPHGEAFISYAMKCKIICNEIPLTHIQYIHE